MSWIELTQNNSNDFSFCIWNLLRQSIKCLRRERFLMYNCVTLLWIHENGFDLGSGWEGGISLAVMANNRCVPVKNTLGWCAVVSCACQLFCYFRQFGVSLVTKWTPNKACRKRNRTIENTSTHITWARSSWIALEIVRCFYADMAYNGTQPWALACVFILRQFWSQRTL